MQLCHASGCGKSQDADAGRSHAPRAAVRGSRIRAEDGVPMCVPVSYIMGRVAVVVGRRVNTITASSVSSMAFNQTAHEGWRHLHQQLLVNARHLSSGAAGRRVPAPRGRAGPPSSTSQRSAGSCGRCRVGWHPRCAPPGAPTKSQTTSVFPARPPARLKTRPHSRSMSASPRPKLALASADTGLLPTYMLKKLRTRDADWMLPSCRGGWQAGQAPSEAARRVDSSQRHNLDHERGVCPVGAQRTAVQPPGAAAAVAAAAPLAAGRQPFAGSRCSRSRQRLASASSAPPCRPPW